MLLFPLVLVAYQLKRLVAQKRVCHVICFHPSLSCAWGQICVRSDVKINPWKGQTLPCYYCQNFNFFETNYRLGTHANIFVN